MEKINEQEVSTLMERANLGNFQKSFKKKQVKLLKENKDEKGEKKEEKDEKEETLEEQVTRILKEEMSSFGYGNDDEDDENKIDPMAPEADPIAPEADPMAPESDPMASEGDPMASEMSPEIADQVADVVGQVMQKLAANLGDITGGAVEMEVQTGDEGGMGGMEDSFEEPSGDESGLEGPETSPVPEPPMSPDSEEEENKFPINEALMKKLTETVIARIKAKATK